MNLGDEKITLLLSQLDLPIIQLLDCAHINHSVMCHATYMLCVCVCTRIHINPEPEPKTLSHAKNKMLTFSL
jgi:hypothetical protein